MLPLMSTLAALPHPPESLLLLAPAEPRRAVELH